MGPNVLCSAKRAKLSRRSDNESRKYDYVSMSDAIRLLSDVPPASGQGTLNICIRPAAARGYRFIQNTPVGFVKRIQIQFQVALSFYISLP